MKTLTKLNAELIETDFTPDPVCPQTFAQQPVIGFARAVRVTGAGLVLSSVGGSVAIPMAELWKLAEDHEPKLAPPVEPSAIRQEPSVD